LFIHRSDTLGAMAAQLPAKLKTTADVTRFAQRAAQLEKVKPAIAYWCKLFAFMIFICLP
jgi:hypothetical protein